MKARPGLRQSRSTAFVPAANNSTFKEVLIFEERLKQNAERLQRQRGKYEVFLVLLLVWSGYLIWAVLVEPSIYSLVHYSNTALLLVSLTTLVLFFATGIYRDKIAYAHKFVPQTNRALRPFNVYLNTRPRSLIPTVGWAKGGWWGWGWWGWPTSVVPVFLRPEAPLLSRTNSASSGGSGGSRPASPTGAGSRSLSRSPSASSAHSLESVSTQSIRSSGSGAMRSPPASPPLSPKLNTDPPPTPPATSPSQKTTLPTSLATTPPDPPPPQPTPSSPALSPPPSPVSRTLPPARLPPAPRGVPLAPIPPPTNPRGELIFSSRVTSEFREGYERYREGWEARRAGAGEKEKGGRWFGWGKG